MAGAPTGEKAKSTIVIKRIKKGAHGHHGGAWKIAYADFVTAMMAFFLLMWLLGSTTKGDLKGISDYFQSPLQVALSGGTGAGDATSLIQGGGQDLTQQVGQVKRGDMEGRRRKAALDAMERKKLDDLKDKLDEAIAANPKLAEFEKQIEVTITPDGLRVQIVDDFNRPMFDLGGASVKPYMRDILNEIGKVLNEVDNRIALTGHTDSAGYLRGERGYSNWELSTERANASRRELVAGGMDPGKVVRVVGVADSALLIKEEPRNPLNRRIAIVVLNPDAEIRLRRATGEIEAGNAAELDQALRADPSVAPATGSGSGSATGSGRDAEPAEGPTGRAIRPAGVAGPASRDAAPSMAPITPLRTSATALPTGGARPSPAAQVQGNAEPRR